MPSPTTPSTAGPSCPPAPDFSLALRCPSPEAALNDTPPATPNAPTHRVAHRICAVRAATAEFRREAAAEPLSDTFSQWLTAQYTATAYDEALAAGDAGLSLPVLREMSAVIGVLRRGDHSAARMLLEREWIKLGRAQCRDRMEAKFEQWMEQPDQHRRPCEKTMSAEERAARIRQILKYPEPNWSGATGQPRDCGAARRVASADASNPPAVETTETQPNPAP